MLGPKWTDFTIRVAGCLIVLIILLLATIALGQEHKHGVGDIPDWYASECCDQRHCRPVPYEEVEEQADGSWLHKPTQLVFRDYPAWKQLRDSPDGRFHVCYSTMVYDSGAKRYTGYCMYIIRTGV